MIKQLGQEGDQTGNSGPVDLVEYVPEDKERKLYICNTTNRSVTVSYQKPTIVEGIYGIEGESFDLPPRHSTDATKDILESYPEGTMSASYAAAPNSVDSIGGWGIRQGVLYFPVLAALTFTAFGGKVMVVRKTIDKPGKRVDAWGIESQSQLTSLFFNYTTEKGARLDFKADLPKPPQVPGGGAPYEYTIEMDQEGQATGLLTNFTFTVQAENQEFVRLLAVRPLIPIEFLPGHVQARLSENRRIPGSLKKAVY
ncbi:hypothetical protein [Polyangium spumosum]|uniref:hypothetical protein n=1 Tax=Polyangium spumosum TaxID=889282 RepID=UPI00129B9756|nr:hypothetical protein [Polyangium spumosum]